MTGSTVGPNATAGAADDAADANADRDAATADRNATAASAATGVPARVRAGE